MSGKKERYTRIEEGELRRLREQDNRLRSIQRDLPERLNKVKEEARQEFNQRLTPLEERNKRHEKEIQGLRTNLRSLESQTNKRLQQQKQEFRQQIQQSENRQQENLNHEVSRLESAMEEGFSQQRQEYLSLIRNQRQEYLNLLAQQDEKFTSLIDDERQARKQGQQILQQQIDRVVDNIEQERQRKDKLAQDLLADIEDIWQQIARDYQHQKFTPGSLADLRRGLEMARNNINAGIPEAAISTCQQTYFQLADLRLELEQKEYEWQLIYNAVLEDIKNLITELEANRRCEMELGEGDSDNIDKLAIAVDYWANGDLGQYENQLNQLQTRLKEEESSLTTEQVKEISEQINELQPQLLEIVQLARDNILMSQMRVEIADQVAETLENFGYRIVSDNDKVFAGDDQRNAYYLKLRNVAGDEVITVISPEKEIGANSISINSFSPNFVDENSATQRANAIFSALAEDGIDLGEMKGESQGDNNVRDFNKIKQNQVKRQKN